MPLIFIALIVALPVLDVYATLRFAEALGVPGIALFIPGLVAAVMIMKREARSLKARFVGAIQCMSLNAVAFDSGRRLLAAVLFLVPGFMSDVFGLFLLLIPNRSLATQSDYAGASRGSGFRRFDAAPRADTRSRQRGSESKIDDTAVVDGEYRRLD